MSYFGQSDGSENFFKDFASWLKIENDDSASVTQLFDRISPGYDVHMSGKALPVHRKLISLLTDQTQREALSKNCSILDVACGTGMVGQSLRKAGFTGLLEGVDGSQGMLDQAAKLDVYDKLYQEFLTPNNPTSIPKNNYEVAIVCHGFFPNYLDVEHLELLFSYLKVGGFLAFNVKYDILDDPTDKMMTYVAGIETKLEELVKDEKCAQLVVCDVDGVSPRLEYVNPIRGNQAHKEFIHERHFCFKKL